MTSEISPVDVLSTTQRPSPREITPDLQFRKQWDSLVELQCTLQQFQESIGMVSHHARNRKHHWEVELAEYMTARGSTRRTITLAASQKVGQWTLSQYEARIGDLEALIKKCTNVLDEVTNREFPMTESFVVLMRHVTKEVKSAPWQSPVVSHDRILLQHSPEESSSLLATLSENYLPTLNRPDFVDMAAEFVPARIDRQNLRMDEFHSFKTNSPNVSVKKELTSNLKPNFQLRVSCVAVPEVLELTEIFVGCHSGHVLRIPLVLDGEQDELKGQKVRDKIQELLFALKESHKLSEDGKMKEMVVSAVVRSAPELISPKLRPPSVPVAGKPGKSSSRLVTPGGKKQQPPAVVSPAPPTAVMDPLGVLVYQGHDYEVVALLLTKTSNHGSILISSSVDKLLRVHQVETGRLLTVFMENSAVVRAMALFSPNALHSDTLSIKKFATVLTASYSGDVTLRDSHFGDVGKFRIQGPIHTTAVIGKDNEHTLQLLDNFDDHIAATSEVFFGLRSGILVSVRLNFVFNGLRLLLHNEHPCFYVRVFGATPSTWKPPFAQPDPLYIATNGHTNRTTVLTVFSGFLFSGDGNGKVLQWDLKRNLFVRQFHGHIDDITSIQLTGDGLLFTSSLDALIYCWNVDLGIALRRVNRHYHSVTGLLLGFRSGVGSGSRSSSCVTLTAVESEQDLGASLASSIGPALSKLSAPILVSVSKDQTFITWQLGRVKCV